MSKVYWKASCAILLAVMLGSVQAQGTGPATSPQQIPDGYAHAATLIDLGHGRRLNLRCSGSGPQTVMLEAGSSADSSTWFRLQPLLASAARVCAYDRAGYGFSSEGPLPRDIDADVSDLHALIHTAGIGTPLVLVGHSLGTNIVRRYADRYPTEVSGLVLIDPPPQNIDRFIPGWSKEEEALSVKRFAFLSRCQAAAETHRLPSSSPELSSCINRHYPHASAKLQAANVAHKATPAFWRTLASELHNNLTVFRNPVSADETHGSIPLIVLCAADTFADAPPQYRKGLEAARHNTQMQIVATSTRAKFEFVEHSSHDIQIDQPSAVAGAITWVLQLARADSSETGHGPKPGKSKLDDDL